MDGRQDHFFAARLGDVEQTINAGEVLEVVRPEAYEVEGQVLASFFLT